MSIATCSIPIKIIVLNKNIIYFKFTNKINISKMIEMKTKTSPGKVGVMMPKNELNS